MDHLGHRLGENYVKQIVEDGYFHADPHPGNIWIRGGKIVWLDLGMMGRLSGRDRSALRKAVFALANHDTLEMKAAVLSLGLPRGRVDHTRLYEDIDVLMEQYRDLDFGTLQMGLLTRQIMHVLRVHRIGIGRRNQKHPNQQRVSPHVCGAGYFCLCLFSDCADSYS